MPSGSLHSNQPLTNISLAYKNEDYIAEKVIPALPVLKSSDIYYIYNADFRLLDPRRAYGASSKQVTWGVSTASYKLTWNSLKDSVCDKDRENADTPLSLDADTTEFLTDKIMLKKEQDAAQILFTTTSWSVSRSITSSAESWDTSTAYPVQAIISVASLILSASGKLPNVGVMGKQAFDIIRENTNVISRIQYVERAIVTKDILASLFDLDSIEVGTAILDTAQEGLTSGVGSTAAFLWGDDFFLGYFAPNPGRKMVSAAYKLYKPSAQKVKKWRDEEIEGDWIEVSDEYQFRAVASACGGIVKNIKF